MRLCILSRGPQLYSTQRLVKEAENRGVEVEIVDPLETSLVLGEQNGQVIHRGWPIEADAVIPRIGYSVTSEGCLLYTSPSPRDRQKSRMPSSA